jgi:hypothetical protein
VLTENYIDFTSKNIDFTSKNIDRFASGLEIALARSKPGYITLEQTKVIAIFLDYLRCSIGSHHLQRESALWLSRRERASSRRKE